MTGDNHAADRHGQDVSATARAAGALNRSTGVKMFFILVLAMLPIGILALFASLLASRTSELEQEALLRVAVTQSARKLSTDLSADRTAMAITANALSNYGGVKGLCERLSFFLSFHDHEGARFYIYNRDGRRLCGADEPEPPGISAADRFRGGHMQLLPEPGYLVLREVSENADVVALVYYSAQRIASVADPATALQNRSLSLQQQGRQMVISRASNTHIATGSSLSARLDAPDVWLTMTVTDAPVTWPRLLPLLLPLLLWFASAAVGWYVVHRLLIRPLVILRRSVASYRPGEVVPALPPMRTPAQEIVALGDTFRDITKEIATHESEMADALETQRKLTREVHHRVKNNLQIIASLINLHSRSAHEPDVMEAYASIQRRVDALSVVHRNHFAELEDNKGVGVRSLISELAGSLRGTAPAKARRFGIQMECDNLHISQDVAVPVAFLLTELVELAMLTNPQASMHIAIETNPDQPERARLIVASPALRTSERLTHLLKERYSYVLTGLSRQLRAPLEHDEATGTFIIEIAIIA